MTTANELREKISDWLNDRNNNEYDIVEFLIDECGVVLKPEKWSEYEVEYGCMIDEETPGEGISIAFQEKKDAKEYYDKLVSNNEYDYVYLLKSNMEGEDCMSSDTIEEYNPEGHKKKK